MTFDLLTPEVDRCMPLAWDHLCQFALISVHSFSKIAKHRVHNSVTDGRTNKQTNGGMDERTARPGRRHKNSRFAEGIAFVCSYDAERVLSAIAKFLVHLKGIGRLEGEAKGMGRARGEKG